MRERERERERDARCALVFDATLEEERRSRRRRSGDAAEREGDKEIRKVVKWMSKSEKVNNSGEEIRF